MNSKTIYGVVRHYWTANSIAEERADPENFYRKNGIHYHPYGGILKKATDLDDFERDPVWSALRELPDGEEVEITIKAKGKSQCAKGFVWAWVKSGDYERIPESDFEKMIQLEMSETPKKEGQKHRVELSDVQGEE